MNRRKQKLEVKVEEMSADEPGDPFLPNDELNSTWLLECGNAPLDITPTFTSLNEEILNLLDYPLDLDDEPLSQENKEIFQNLQFTSTPKSRTAVSTSLYDSGIEESSSNKKIRKEASCNTLHDITDKFDSSCNSFINISQLSENNTPIQNSNKKHVSILRKDIITKPKPVIEKNHFNPLPKDQLTYYTGIKDYNTAIAILKHLKMPKGKFSSFKMEFITLMKMRLNLQWKDMSFRFSMSEKELINLTSVTIDIMNYSFNDLLPWHVQKRVMRRTVKCIYAHTLFCENTGIQVLVLFVDSKRPVLFASSPHSLDKTPIYLLNDCAKYLIPGDVICLCDLQGNRNYYKIDQSNTGLSVVFLEETTFVNCPFVENCQKVVLQILSEFSIILKPETGMDLVKLIKIAGALTNINAMNEINPGALGKIYQRSVDFIERNIVS